eukprot:591923-Prymnesium_polylepis.1
MMCGHTHAVRQRCRHAVPHPSPPSSVTLVAQVRAENVRLTSEMEARTRDLTEIATMSGETALSC